RVPLATYGALFDTLSVCLSKGLGATVGAVVVPAAEPIAAGRAIRKCRGGGIPQICLHPEAGRYALAHHGAPRAEEHGRARRLAAALASLGVVDAATVRTNIVLLELTKSTLDAAALAGRAKQAGVLVSVLAPHLCRLITHLDVNDAAIDQAIDVLVSI